MIRSCSLRHRSHNRRCVPSKAMRYSWLVVAVTTASMQAAQDTAASYYDDLPPPPRLSADAIMRQHRTISSSNVSYEDLKQSLTNSSEVVVDCDVWARHCSAVADDAKGSSSTPGGASVVLLSQLERCYDAAVSGPRLPDRYRTAPGRLDKHSPPQPTPP